MRALADAKFPVPHCYFLCTDESVIGTPFFVMAFVEGRIFTKPTMPNLKPSQRAEILKELARVAAQLHDVDFVNLYYLFFFKKKKHCPTYICVYSQTTQQIIYREQLVWNLLEDLQIIIKDMFLDGQNNI
jgi:hypothetical protein